jgi:HD superfamily phosphodiesterase
MLKKLILYEPVFKEAKAMNVETQSLAKGGIYRDQTLKAHSKVTSQIAKYVAELRKFDDKHSTLLFLAAYYHDMGKGILEKYMGSHKIQLERCLEELEKESLKVGKESEKIIAHLILRHHYTSKEDVSKLSEIFVPADVNIDVLLRMLRFCDHLASIEDVNHAHLDELSKLGSPLELFAYTISLEGLVAGKIMDLTDEVLKEENGKGIFYHNGSIFLFEKGKLPNLDSIRSKIEDKLRDYFKNEIFKVESVIGIGDLGKTIIAPIESLNSGNFEFAWLRLMYKFNKRKQPKRGESLDNAIDKAYKLVQCAVAEIFGYFEGSEYSLKSPKITLNSPADIFSPIIKDVEKELGSAKTTGEFTRWSSEDMNAIGKRLLGRCS